MNNKPNTSFESSPNLRSALDKLLGTDKSFEDAGIADAKDAFNDARNFLREEAQRVATKVNLHKECKSMKKTLKHCKKNP